MGGDRGAHQDHQRANPGGAEEGGVGGAGPPVKCSRATEKNNCHSFLPIVIFIFRLKVLNADINVK